MSLGATKALAATSGGSPGPGRSRRTGFAIEARVEAQQRDEELRQKFRELDNSGDGRLSFAETLAVLAEYKPNVTERQALAMFDRIDVDSSGQLNYNELCEFILSQELAEAREGQRKSNLFTPWEGPEQLKVNGSWDRETRLVLQEFLAVQDTPTARCVKPLKFINGEQLHASHIVVLQELLQNVGVPAAVENGPNSLASGVWNERTTRALHELFLMQNVPTAVGRGESFAKERFGKPTIFALQEFLAMTRKSRGTALSVVQ